MEDGDKYWVADPTAINYTTIGLWTNCKLDKSILISGLLHRSRENAIAHAKALIKLSGGTVDE